MNEGFERAGDTLPSYGYFIHYIMSVFRDICTDTAEYLPQE